MILIPVVLAALYMGWSMGANDAANCVGADIGSGMMSLRDGIIILSSFILKFLKIGYNNRYDSYTRRPCRFIYGLVNGSQ